MHAFLFLRSNTQLLPFPSPPSFTPRRLLARSDETRPADLFGFSVSNKEQKKILADIESGSQKFGRKFLTRQPSKRATYQHTSNNNDASAITNEDAITPVAVPVGTASDPLPPPEPTQEDRRGRKSTSSNRPRIGKRTSSMKRAYNYFFGGVDPKTQQPPSPTSPVTSPVNAEATTTPAKDDANVAAAAGVQTPPDTPAQATHNGENGIRLVRDDNAEDSGAGK